MSEKLRADPDKRVKRRAPLSVAAKTLFAALIATAIPSSSLNVKDPTAITEVQNDTISSESDRTPEETGNIFLKKVLDAVPIPQEINAETVRDTLVKLKKVHFELCRLGVTHNGFNRKLADANTQIVSEHLRELETRISDYTTRLEAKDTHAPNEAIYLLALFQAQLARFYGSSDGFFEEMVYTEPVAVTFDDEKAPYLNVGLSNSEARDVISAGVKVDEVQYYFVHGHIRPFYKYLKDKVPHETLSHFLEMFTDDEKYRYADSLRSTEVARAVAWYAKSSNEEGLTALAQLVKSFPGLWVTETFISPLDSLRDEEKNQYVDDAPNDIFVRLLEAKGDTYSYTQQLAKLNAYMHLGIGPVATLSAIDAHKTVHDISDVLTRYERVIDDKNTLAKIYIAGHDMNLINTQIQKGKQTEEDPEKIIKMALLLNPTEFLRAIPFIQLARDRQLEWSPSHAISFAQGKVSLPEIQKYVDTGNTSMADIMDCISLHLSPEDAKEIHDLNPQLFGRFVALVSSHGIRVPRIKTVYRSITDSEFREQIFMTSETFLAYEKNMQLPQFVERFNSFVAQIRANSPGDIISVDMIMSLASREQGVTQQTIDFANTYKCWVFAEAIEKYNISEIGKELAKNSRVGCNFGVISQLKKIFDNQLADPADLLQYLRAHNTDAQMILRIALHGIPFRELLPEYRDFVVESDTPIRAIQTLAFFGVSPDRLRMYAREVAPDRFLIDKDHVDYIVRNEFERGHLPERTQRFLKKTKLEFVSRYPVKILDAMEKRHLSEAKKESIQSKKPKAYMIFPKTDWNTAWEYGDRPVLYAGLLNGYEIEIVEVESDKDLFSVVNSFLREIKQDTKRSAPHAKNLLYIAGHGTTGSIRVSSHYEAEDQNLFSLSDLKNNPFIHVQDLSDKLQVVLESCSTGAGREPIAYALSSALGGTLVLAPGKDIVPGSYTLNPDGTLAGVFTVDGDAFNKIQAPAFRAHPRIKKKK